MLKHSKLIASLTLIFSILGVVILFFWVPKNLPVLNDFFSEHKLLGPTLVIGWRILAIVIPPVSGGFVTYALIPIYGWLLAYLYGAIGVLTGCSVAFFLARRFREPLVKKFVPLQQLHNWEGKISKRTEFFAFLAIRLTTGPVLDFISYIAGLSKISFRRFFVATLISYLPEAFLYYAGEYAYKRSIYLTIGLTILILVGYYIFRKMKFFEDINK